MTEYGNREPGFQWDSPRDWWSTATGAPVRDAIGESPVGGAIPGSGTKGVPDTLMGVANSGNPEIYAGWKKRIPGYQYGCNGDSLHHGVDVSAEPGTPVKAWHDGRVVFTKYSEGINAGWISIYYPSQDVTIETMHLQRGSLTQSQQVQKGETYGKVGTRADAGGTEPHAHFRAFTGEKNGPVPNAQCVDVNPRPYYDERSGGVVDSAGNAMSSIADSIRNLPQAISQGLVSALVSVFKWLFGKFILQPFDWLSGFSWELLSSWWESFTDVGNRPLFGPYNRQRLYFLGIFVLTYSLLWGRTREGAPRMETAINQAGDGVNYALGEQNTSRNREPQDIDFDMEMMGSTTARVERGKTTTSLGRRR